MTAIENPAFELRCVGFWISPDEPDLPDPHFLVDPNWNVQERAQIVAYLKNGLKFISYMGYAFCRFEDGPTGREMGAWDLSDGKWVWPEGLWIYVDRYNVKLPEEFVSDMRASSYRLPLNLDSLKGKKLVFNSEFWLEWSTAAIRESRDRHE
jgi:hypothetical protein